jgi:hypothetical protein
VDSRVSSKKPLTILCQHDVGQGGSCAACCGLDNFHDRSDEATARRVARRTALVLAAWPNVERLAEARDRLLAEEAPDVLFAGVKVCPFAGQTAPGRVGCLLHPSRHPSGDDLRDLAVYPRAVCEGHFCAPHDWLRPREIAVAQTASGLAYGRIVTDAGLVKAVCALVDEARGAAFAASDVEPAAGAFGMLWRLFRAWPYQDTDPRRFGAFTFVGDEATERSLPSCLAGTSVEASRAARTVLDALSTRALDDTEAAAALALLSAAITRVAAASSRPPRP